ESTPRDRRRRATTGRGPDPRPARDFHSGAPCALEYARGICAAVSGILWFPGGLQRLRLCPRSSAGSDRIDLSVCERGGSGGIGLAVLPGTVWLEGSRRDADHLRRR